MAEATDEGSVASPPSESSDDRKEEAGASQTVDGSMEKPKPVKISGYQLPEMLGKGKAVLVSFTQEYVPSSWESTEEAVPGQRVQTTSARGVRTAVECARSGISCKTGYGWIRA
eukprot:scaffold1483_cov379-Prasinococcus_capsulatus_cf.AAC.3